MSATFPCPGCGIIYPWKPEFVGRQLGCKKCGGRITMPAAPPPPPSLFDEIGSIAETHRPRPEAVAPKPRIAAGRTVTMRNGAYASNAGLIRIQWAKYLECFWQEPLVTAVCVGIGIVAFILYDQANKQLVAPPLAVGIGMLIAVGVVFFRLYQKKEHLWHGCLCPAVVVSQRPFLVAVATDLTLGHGSYPAVKVIRQPLGQMTGGAPAVGTRLATVSVYYAGDGATRWQDFEPVVINCVTTDEKEIREALDSIPDDEWQLLLAGIRRLGGRFRVGKVTLLD